jgi:hypothetical protein
LTRFSLTLAVVLWGAAGSVGASAAESVLVGRPLDPGAPEVPEVTATLRRSLAPSEPEDVARSIRQALGEAGDTCDEACARELAGRFPQVRLLVALSNAAGGWTAGRVEEWSSQGVEVLGSFLCRDLERAAALAALVAHVQGDPAQFEVFGARGSAVYLDGERVGELPLAGALKTSAGGHVLKIGEPPVAGGLRVVRLLPGENPAVDVREPRPWWRRPWVWAVAGAAVAGGATFAATDGFGTLRSDTVVTPTF